MSCLCYRYRRLGLEARSIHASVEMGGLTGAFRSTAIAGSLMQNRLQEGLSVTGGGVMAAQASLIGRKSSVHSTSAASSLRALAQVNFCVM